MMCLAVPIPEPAARTSRGPDVPRETTRAPERRPTTVRLIRSRHKARAATHAVDALSSDRPEGLSSRSHRGAACSSRCSTSGTTERGLDRLAMLARTDRAARKGSVVERPGLPHRGARPVQDHPRPSSRLPRRREARRTSPGVNKHRAPGSQIARPLRLPREASQPFGAFKTLCHFAQPTAGIAFPVVLSLLQSAVDASVRHCDRKADRPGSGSTATRSISWIGVQKWPSARASSRAASTAWARVAGADVI